MAADWGKKHPRRRGEDNAKFNHSKRDQETPPQARGRLFHAFKYNDRYRNTPAGAGKTANHEEARRAGQKHPRRRGEDRLPKPQGPDDEETPPQARGRRPMAPRSRLKVGNTPAGAGKTWRPRTGPWRPWKHPRRRGEDSHSADLKRLRPETPPQARGRRSVSEMVSAWGGNTPAGAGKTEYGKDKSGEEEKHPRRRGEDCDLDH